ncbi:subclass B1 metallo-beta-lactamase [Thalassotalea sp. HSM 43]|uniref:subclass B1 metallo-beta-lactamase n=1 Tax=Thalassotalea sp. HSM 43 TaxID=2552945 RepID=UPI0010814346|nr:subclass B1 metallo-beta-lactamase [Thalassotalea sp. HSM 43]QBY04360.1 subclass B1 metallo-beta-lactamase [Thalassotalea sp. HSM 43]
MKTLLLSLVMLSFSAVATEKSQPLNVKLIADNVYQHISYQYISPWGLVAASGLVVVEDNQAYVIDTPWTQADSKQLIAWIEAQGFQIKAVVATHFHEDASGGLAVFNQLDIATYASVATNQLLSDKKRTTASEVITQQPFALTENSIEIFYPGAGHSNDNVVVWLAQQKLLFAGCFAKSLGSKSLGNLADASVADWPQSIDKVLTQYPSIQTVVPGHGKIGTVDILHHTKRLAQQKLAADNAGE